MQIGHAVMSQLNQSAEPFSVRRVIVSQKYYPSETDFLDKIILNSCIKSKDTISEERLRQILFKCLLLHVPHLGLSIIHVSSLVWWLSIRFGVYLRNQPGFLCAHKQNLSLENLINFSFGRTNRQFKTNSANLKNKRCL